MRALKLARENKQGRIVIVANKVSSSAELDLIKQSIDHDAIVVVPFSEALVDADRRGISVFDVKDNETFITPIERLAVELVG